MQRNSVRDVEADRSSATSRRVAMCHNSKERAAVVVHADSSYSTCYGHTMQVVACCWCPLQLLEHLSLLPTCPQQQGGMSF
jgi:hypothetical protein